MGLRGGLEKAGQPNLTNVYDDLIFFINEPGGTVTAWIASVDPSDYYLQHPINVNGTAELMEGVWLFEVGIHLGNSSHQCLIQAEEFEVYRLDGTGKKIGTEKGDFGIHLHSGGRGMSTQNFSAGCQIIHNEDGYFGNPTWGNFMDPIKDALDKLKLSTIPYLLTSNLSQIQIPHNIQYENPLP